MPRDVDERKKRKALRKLRRAADLAEQGQGPPLSDWEQAFLEELEERIETYGSAFADPAKGDLSEPLSALQARKLKEIDRKARGKGAPGARKSTGQPNRNGLGRVRTKTPATETGADPQDGGPGSQGPSPKPGLRPVPISRQAKPIAPPRPASSGDRPRPTLRVIDGGRSD